MEKMTVKDYFMEVREIVANAEIEDEKRARALEFIDSRIAQVKAKNARRSDKPTAKQVENLDLMNRIVETMEDGKRYRVSEINKFDFLKDYSANKVNALVRGLKLDGRVIKETEKNIAYFVKA